MALPPLLQNPNYTPKPVPGVSTNDAVEKYLQALAEQAGIRTASPETQAAIALGIGQRTGTIPQDLLNRPEIQSQLAGIREAEASQERIAYQNKMNQRLISERIALQRGDSEATAKSLARTSGVVPGLMKMVGQGYPGAILRPGGKPPSQLSKLAPEAFTQSDYASEALKYWMKEGGSQWSKLPENQARTKIAEFTRLLTGGTRVFVDKPGDYTEEDKDAATLGAVPGSYSPYSTKTFSSQERPVPILVDGETVGGLPVAARKLLENVYGGNFPSAVPAQSEFIFTGAPAIAARYAEMSAGTNEFASMEFGAASAAQMLANDGIDPLTVDPFGVWANLLRKSMDPQVSLNLWKQAQARAVAIASAYTDGTAARIVNPEKKDSDWITKFKDWVLQEGKQSGSGSAGFARVNPSKAIQTAEELASAGINYSLSAYYAATQTGWQENAGLLEGIRTGVAALVGRAIPNINGIGTATINMIGGDVNGVKASERVWRVDSREERAALGLASLGENLMYDITGEAHYKVFGKFNASGLVDGAAQVFLDPTTYTPFIAARFGSAPLRLAARMGIRRAGASLSKDLAKISQESLTFSRMAGTGAKKGAVKLAIEELTGKAYIATRTAAGFVRPGKVLTPLAKTAAARSAREVILDSTMVLRSYVADVAEQIGKFGDDATRLRKVFSDWDDEVVLAVAEAAKIGGKEAAMEVVREAAINGTLTVKITIRRQIVATIGGYLESPAAGLGIPAGTSRNISGHSVPLFLGRSSIKPFKGRTVRALESLSGRVNVWGPLAAATLGGKVTEIAERLTGKLDILLFDRAKIVADDLEASGVSLAADGFAERIARLVQIGTDGDVFPGLDKLGQELAQNSEGLSVEDLGKVIGHLEAAVDIALNGNERQFLLAQELISRTAGVIGPEDLFARAQRRLFNIGTIEIPKARRLVEWVNLSDAKYHKAIIPFTPKKVLKDALRAMERETERLIKFYGRSDAMTLTAISEREQGLTRLSNAMAVVREFAYRRININGYRDSRLALVKEVFDRESAILKTERETLINRKLYIKSVKEQIENAPYTDVWIPTKDARYRSGRILNEETREWIEVESKKVADGLKANLEARQALQRQVETKNRLIKREAADRIKESNTITQERYAAEELVAARANMVGKSAADVKFKPKINEKVIREGLKGYPDALARYAALAGVAVDDYSDPFIRGIIDANKNIALNGIPIFPTPLEVIRRFALDRVVQTGQALRGERLFGQVFNVLDGGLGVQNRQSIFARIENLPVVLRQYFEEKVNDAIANNVTDISHLARDVENLATNPEVANAIAEEMIREDKLLKWIAANASGKQIQFGGKAGMVSRAAKTVVSKGAKLGLSFVESVAPKTIRFASHPNAAIGIMSRVQEADRVAMDYGFDAATRKILSDMVTAAQSVDDLFAIIVQMQKVWAGHMNIPYKVLADFQTDIWNKAGTKFIALADGSLGEGVQTLSQRTNEVIVMSADEARRLAREYSANVTEAMAKEDGIVWLGKGNVIANRMHLMGTNAANTSFAKFLKGGLKVWKAAVVTGVPTIFIGAGAGFYFGDPSTSKDDGLGGLGMNKLSYAGMGALLGSLGGIRYIGRVAGIEEGLRKIVAMGFTSRVWISTFSKLSEFGVDLPSRHLDELISSTGHPLSHIAYNKVFAVSDETWEFIDKNNRFFVDAWARIVNRQIQPEVGRNMLDRIILMHYDDANGVDWREAAEAWLTSPAGSAELAKMRGGFKGPRSIDQILDGYAQFIDTYLPNPSIRNRRLHSTIENPISREEFKAMADAGDAPISVHAQRTWIRPKNLKDAWLSSKEIYGRLVMQGPTTKLNRVPMAKALYSQEYRAMRKEGVGPELARTVAEQRAYRLTNKVMFQISEESRFAAKADFFFPFQQPREELIRVYSSLVADNLGRAVQLTRLGALAFNNGKESGIFVEDSYGEYRMRIPGSAWLSRVFGPTEATFDIKVRDLFFLLQGNAFAASSASPDFSLDKPINVLLGTLPAPGGPYWSMAVGATAQFYPELFINLKKEQPWIYNRMFPYGTQGAVMRPEATRLFEAFSGFTPPWEFSNPVAQQNSLRNVQVMVVNEMLFDNRGNPDYIGYLESEEGQQEIRKKTSSLLLTWVVMGSVTPAPTRPIMPGQREMDSISETLKEQFGDDWYSELYKLRPDLAAIYFAKKNEPNDKGSFELWLESGSGNIGNKAMNIVKNLSVEDYLEEMKVSKIRSSMMQEINNAYNMPTFGTNDAFRELRIVESKYSESMRTYGFNPRNDYMAKKQLSKIIVESNSDNYESKINEWRKEFNVSAKDYKEWLTDSSRFRLNPYAEARTIPEILFGSDGKDGAEAALAESPRKELLYIATLPAAEQLKYWQFKASNVSYVENTLENQSFNPDAAWQGTKYTYATYKNLADKVYENNPVLTDVKNWKVPTGIQIAQKALIENNGAYLDSINTKLAQAREARDIAYKSKDWTTYQSLKTQVNALTAQRTTILEALYKKYPDLIQANEDLKGIVYLQQNPNSPDAIKAYEDLMARYAELGVPVLIFGNEEKGYLASPPAVRAAYKEELVSRLNYEQGKTLVNGFDQKLYWDKLTPFQKDILERSPLPMSIIEKWKGEIPGNAKGGGYPSGSGQASSSLEYAYALMKQYSKRPAGAVAPPGYSEYLKIPAGDYAARTQYLKDHPEVGDWVRLGPMSNMPSIYRNIVADIMVKYGNWEGEAMSDVQITNLSWAQMQMEQWSRRTGDKPNTYDLWVNMPTGVEKAEYLRAHPEVQQWIKDGPMSNMPDALREIVRDIMAQYGSWSETSDPLGETINGFYKVPKGDRQAYLDAHPELREYWKATRTPEEQHIADMTEQYFALPDGPARRIYLSAHPELKQHFVDSRNMRYDRFLQSVAFYMGSNPAVFDDYLRDQQRTINELIARFGTKSLLRERTGIAGTGKVTTGVSGRVRAA